MVSLQSLLGQFGGIVGSLSLPPALAAVAGLSAAWSVALLLGFAAVLFIGIPDRPVSQVGSLRVQHVGASGREEAIEVKPLAVTAADLEGEPRQPRPRR